MKITRIVVIPLVGLLVILGACASPAATTPVATAPANPAPVAPTPVPTPPAPATTVPVPTPPPPATPVPVPTTPAPMTVLVQIISKLGMAQALEYYGGEFSPQAIAVAVGGTVTWTNTDNKDHDVISNDGLFPNQRLKYGDSFSYTFTKSGTFSVHDDLYDNINGTVIVK